MDKTGFPTNRVVVRVNVYTYTGKDFSQNSSITAISYMGCMFRLNHEAFVILSVVATYFA